MNCIYMYKPCKNILENMHVNQFNEMGHNPAGLLGFAARSE